MAFELVGRHAALSGRYDQRSLGRVPLDRPAPLLLGYGRVVAERAGPQALEECAVRPGCNPQPALAHLSFGCVSDAGELVAAPARKYFLHRHLVLGERPGLVGAYDRRRSQRLDGGQLAYDRAPLRHPRDAYREHDRDGGWEPLGDRADGQRHRGHERLHHSLPARYSYRERGSREPQDDVEEPTAELRYLASEGRSEFLGARYEFGDVADLGEVTRRDHDAHPLPARDERHRVGHAVAVSQGHVAVDRLLPLVNRYGFAREHGLVGVEFVRGYEPHVCRDLVARGEHDHIARDELLGRNPLTPPVAHDRRVGLHAPGERGYRRHRLGFLDEPDHRIYYHDSEYYRRILVLPEDESYERGGEQYVDQGLVELEEKPDEGPVPLAGREEIETEARPARLHLGTREPLCGV